jgi:hypothetical protein
MTEQQAPRADFSTLSPQRWLITGGTGFIGSALVQALVAGGHTVSVLSRQPDTVAKRLGSGVRAIQDLASLAADEAFDVVVNLAGAPVVGPPWTAGRKAVLLKSRVGTTASLNAWLARTKTKPALWIQASAIGFYGVRPPDEILTESSAHGGGFMAKLCIDWEAEAAKACASGIRQVVLRLGVVFGPGGALPPLLLPHRFGLGGRMGDGKQMMSWIHRDDVLRLIARAASSPSMQGIYNAVAPDTISQGAFAKAAGAALHRPVWLPLPAWPLRLLMGDMAQLFVDGQHVVPRRLQAEGFTFRFPTVAGALAAETAR